MKRLLIILMLLSLLLLLFTGQAFAALYSVVAYDNSSLGTSAWGVNGTNYVMSSPAIYNLHVSSIYVYKPTGDYWTEIGWCWHSNYSNPRFFGAYTRRGYYFHTHFRDAPKGTNHYYTVRDVDGSNDWVWNVDGGAAEWYVNMEGWKAGYVLASSERNHSSETNYSHFWSLDKRDQYANWYTWSNLQLYKDNDPNYYLRKISNTECYMQQ